MNETIKDSGSKREFSTGAHRDNASGKGRTDLLPLKEVSMVMDDPVIREVSEFMEDHNIWHLANAIAESVDTLNKFHYPTIKAEMQEMGIELAGIKSDSPEELKNTMKQACLAHMMIEASKLYEAGAAKYGENNWKHGMPLKAYIDSGMRHYLKTIRGDADEPHYRGFIWNILCAMWTVNNVEDAINNLIKIE